jgi:hypothetical protein
MRLALLQGAGDAPAQGRHVRLVTMHVWIWYPNPDGLYASMDPLVHAFG